jgi:hypothetical protein
MTRVHMAKRCPAGSCTEQMAHFAHCGRLSVTPNNAFGCELRRLSSVRPALTAGLPLCQFTDVYDLCTRTKTASEARVLHNSRLTAV